MTHTAHTPGPWRLANEGNGIIADMPNDCDCIQIAEVTYAPMGLDVEGVRTREMTLEEHKANARLISAAPELLEALEQLLKEAEEQAVAWQLSCKTQVQAAIAKAKGE